MTNVVGPRAVFGVIVPSTNTVVEHDYWRAGIDGVAFRAGSMHIADPSMNGDAGFEALLVQIRASIDTAVRDALTAEPDRLVMGMSAETFWDGKDGNEQFKRRIKERSGGLDVATGAEGCERALNLFGAKKIGVVTPYQENADRQVIGFFEELGFDVTKLIGLKCPTAVSIAHVTEDTLREAILDLDRAEVDAIVQVGTNLSMVRLAAEAERWLHKPVIAINAATWWMALRESGIDDKLYGFGRLLEEF